MIFNLLVLVLVLFIAYMWATHGLFSAFIHMVCTIVAGAVAFAVWEPLVSGVLLGVREDIAWSIGLAGPFLLTLLGLRVAADKLIPANLEFDNTTNLIGGGAFGLVSSVITMGVLVLSMGFLRLPPSVLGYQPVVYDAQGSLVRGGSLWIPVDKLTSDFYERLSLAGFSTDEPLALHQPDVDEQSGALRVTFNGTSRTTVTRDSFSVVGRYTVVPGGGDSLYADSFNVNNQGQPIPQVVKAPNGDVLAAQKLEGIVLKFNSKAREKSGQIVIGPGQLRLVCEVDDHAIAVHPVAMISQAKGSDLSAGRFRFDAQEVFIASVGGAADATMAFEFPLPAGAKPTDLLVKNIRVPIESIKPLAAAPAEGFTVAQRDSAIRNLAILAMGAGPAGAQTDTSSAATIAAEGYAGARDAGIAVTSSLPQPFNKSYRASLELNDKNAIINGQHKFAREELGGSMPSTLAVSSFATPADTSMVQVDVSLQSKLSLLGKSVQTAESVLPPVLVDNLGQQYQAVGWIFEEQDAVDIRYLPGDPVRGLSQIPTLSRSRPDQRLKLLFVVTKGVNITSFNLGGKALYVFDPPVKVF